MASRKSSFSKGLENAQNMLRAVGILFVAVIVDFTIFVLFFPLMDGLMPDMNMGKAIVVGGGYVLMFLITFVLPIAIAFEKV